MQILNGYTGVVLYENAEVDNLRELVETAVRNGVNLRGANLICADLREANLREANLRKVDLRGANLRGASLSCADFREADLRGANLRETNLREADLRGADLRGANLREANFQWVDLRRADLSGTDLPHPIYQFYLGRHHAVAQPTELRIGCEVHSWEHWLSNYAEIGRAANMSEADIELYGEVIKLFYRLITAQVAQRLDT